MYIYIYIYVAPLPSDLMCMLCINGLFPIGLGVFAKLLKATVSFAVPVRLSTRINSYSTGQVLTTFEIAEFFDYLLRLFTFH
jgi:hypothetical protein